MFAPDVADIASIGRECVPSGHTVACDINRHYLGVGLIEIGMGGLKLLWAGHLSVGRSLCVELLLLGVGVCWNNSGVFGRGYWGYGGCGQSSDINALIVVLGRVEIAHCQYLMTCRKFGIKGRNLKCMGWIR